MIQELTGNASKPNESIDWTVWGSNKNMNGEEMLKFPKHNEMKTLNDRVKKAAPEWTRQCILKGESSILDFIVVVTVVENRSGKETELHVFSADVGTTDHCLIWTDSRPTRVIKRRRGGKIHRWRIDKLEVSRKRDGKTSKKRWIKM